MFSTAARHLPEAGGVVSFVVEDQTHWIAR